MLGRPPTGAQLNPLVSRSFLDAACTETVHPRTAIRRGMRRYTRFTRGVGMDSMVFSPSLVTPGTLPEQCTGTRFLLGRRGDLESRAGQPDALLDLPTVMWSVHK